jgi:hypothetical protein
MKRLTALLCALLALSAACAPALAVMEQYSYSGDVYHEPLGVPWGIDIDEFLEGTERYGLCFTVDKADIYAKSYTSVFYAFCHTSPDEPIYLFDYPATICASFEYSSKIYGHDEKGPFAEADLDEGKWELFTISFRFLVPIGSAPSAWFMADDVFHRLYSNHGEPWAAFFVPYGPYPYDAAFALPMAGKRLDVRELLKKRVERDALYARFDNIAYEFRPDLLNRNAGEDNAYAARVGFFSPDWSSSFLFKAPVNVQPFEDYDPNHIPPILRDPDAPAPTPQKRIDIDLW